MGLQVNHNEVMNASKHVKVSKYKQNSKNNVSMTRVASGSTLALNKLT